MGFEPTILQFCRLSPLAAQSHHRAYFVVPLRIELSHYGLQPYALPFKLKNHSIGFLFLFTLWSCQIVLARFGAVFGKKIEGLNL